MGGTIVVICANVSQKYIYASVRGGLGPIRGVFFAEQGVGVGQKKGVLKGITLHIIWGIFEKYKNWVLGGVEFGLGPFQTM
jgi:hypothetical protein